MKSIFFDEIANTQDYAIKEFKAEPLLIVSKAQTAGRGTNKNKCCLLYTYPSPRDS